MRCGLLWALWVVGWTGGCGATATVVPAGPRNGPSSALSQPSASATTRAVKDVRDRASEVGSPLILWTVHRGDGLVGYLHGSVHVLPNADVGRDPRIEQAFEDSDVLVVEVDGTAGRSVQLLTVQLGMYPPGESLADHISEDMLSQVMDRSAELAMPQVAVMRMRPWLLAMTMTLRGMAEQGVSPEYGIDSRYLNAAHRAGTPMKVIALETAESQLRLFSDLSEEQQVLFLRDVLLRSRDNDELQRILDAWIRGDAGALAEQLFAPLRQDPRLHPLYDTFYFKRNRAMAERLVELFVGPGVCFVVVGTAHLVGDQSIVTLLRRRGFTVEQVVVSPPQSPNGLSRE